ncbi:MAG TPA: PhzF family phenazine biosynthesis protein [Rhodanobacteraceae bacterium]
MFPLRYLQLDVFPAGLGGGNPLGIVFGAAHWNSAQMQHFAAWTGLVETTFVLPPHEPSASYRLRIFTPHKEIPFAGHPSIGSAHAVLQTGWARPHQGLLLQECGAGVLPVRVEGSAHTPELFIRTPPAHILRDGADAATALAGVINVQQMGQLGGMLVDGGRRWWLTELADEASLRAWQPDHAAIAALARSSQSMGLCVFARALDETHDLAVRAFPAGAGIVEDPASGAANGLIAASIAQREPDGPLAQGYSVSQGREIGHDARIMVRIDASGEVWVGGRTRTIIDGQLAWHDDTTTRLRAVVA